MSDPSDFHALMAAIDARPTLTACEECGARYEDPDAARRCRTADLDPRAENRRVLAGTHVVALPLDTRT